VQKTILSTADVARLFNVTETTVKRWADDGMLKCQRTPGGHRKFEMKHVVDFINEHHYEPTGTLTLDANDGMGTRIQSAVLGRDFNALSQIFVEKVLSVGRPDIFGYLSYLYQHNIALWEIYDLIVAPGMREIGTQWEKGMIGINHEHHASYETLDALAKLQSQIVIKPRNGKSVVCASVGGDMHEIGLRCTSYIFESQGWTVHYLGAMIPHSSIIAAIQEVKPSIVCLSLTNPNHSETIHNEIEEVVAASRRVHAVVIVGGQAAAAHATGGQQGNGLYTSAHELLKHITELGRSERKQVRQSK
jgi:MerR family transcriptional regulator, light-induced transcriptional regulator